MLSKGLYGLALRSTQCIYHGTQSRPQMVRGQIQSLALRSRRSDMSSHLCFRRQSTFSKPTKSSTRSKKSLWVLSKEAFRRHPIQGGLAIFTVMSSFVMLGYANYIYVHYFLGVFHNFPDSVAKPLKRALYYSNISEDPQKAIKYYKMAIFAAEEAGMDPFSDEVLGIKIQVAAFLEKVHSYSNAILILENLRRDCLEWVKTKGEDHYVDGRRNRVLGRTVGIAVKLGELYSMDWIGRRDDAEEVLVEATETVLREKIRREEQGVKEGEGDWLSNEQIGGSVEALGQLYSSMDKHSLATPLYLQALSLCPPRSCHAVIIMNNIASSLAQQSPPSSLSSSSSSSSSLSPSRPPNFPSLPEQATLWANKAIELSQAIPEADRTEECTTGCATAKANLAELAESMGRLEEAKRLYQDAEDTSRTVAFAEGINIAAVGRKRVDKKLRETAKTSQDSMQG